MSPQSTSSMPPSSAISSHRSRATYATATDSERDLESGESDSKSANNNRTPVVFEEKYLVIMAGQVKPTCLATPVSSRASSFGSSSSCRSNSTEEVSKSEMENDKEGRSDQLYQLP
ncbi:hypothetical protein SSX86_026298 [Deinandra increscens subsp. villosa]|uniref:Uncharacterized protein n=1 Tax=Deinandra increscens subsp. villosa TaxID=3103831 RepID=A0AAP0GMY7_9ASTR